MIHKPAECLFLSSSYHLLHKAGAVNQAVKTLTFSEPPLTPSNFPAPGPHTDKRPEVPQMPPPPHSLFGLLLQVTRAQVSRQTGAGSASRKPSCIPPSKGSRCMHMLSELSHFTRLATERWVKGFTTVPPKEPLAGLTSVWVAVGACCRAACGLQLHHQTSLHGCFPSS